MNPRDTTDRLVSAWLELEAPTTVPDDLRTDIHRATTRIRPRPAWLARLRGSPMDVITGGAGVRRESRLVPVLLVFLLVLAFAAAAVFVGSFLNKQPVIDPRASTPVAVASPTARPTPTTPAATPAGSPFFDATLPFPFNVTEIVPGETATWVSIAGEGTELPRSIYRIDHGTATAAVVVPAIGAGATSPLSIIEVGGSLWVVENAADQVIRFSLPDGVRAGEIAVGSSPIEPHAGFGSVWALDYDDGALDRIDPATGNVLATIEIAQFAGQGPRDVAAGQDLLWAITPRQNVMVGIDPATNDVAMEVPLGARLHCGVTVVAGRVWVGGCDAAAPLQVFDDATGAELGSIEDMPALGLPLIESNGAVWIPTFEETAPRTTKLVSVDPETLQAAGPPTVDLGVLTNWIVLDDGAIWYSTGGSDVFRLSLDALPTG